MYPSLPAAEPFGDRRGGKSEIVAGGENDPVVSGKRMEKGVHRMRKLPCLNDLLHIVPPRDALGELVERRGRLTAAACSSRRQYRSTMKLSSMIFPLSYGAAP